MALAWHGMALADWEAAEQTTRCDDGMFRTDTSTFSTLRGPTLEQQFVMG